jgi:hypothetical protein
LGAIEVELVGFHSDYKITTAAKIPSGDRGSPGCVRYGSHEAGGRRVP